MEERLRAKVKGMMRDRMDDYGGYDVGGYKVGGYDMDMMGDYGEGIMPMGGYGIGGTAANKEAAANNPWLKFLASLPKAKKGEKGLSMEEKAKLYKASRQQCPELRPTKKRTYTLSPQDRLRRYIRRYIKKQGKASFLTIVNQMLA